MHGYHGTSIRDIAKEADINLASVNYHFKNKLNLYHELFNRNYMWMGEQVENIAKDESLTFATLAFEVYSFFSTNSDHIVNGFKIMLTQDVTSEEIKQSNTSFGPPGQEPFLKLLDKELPAEVPLEAKLWAVRTIFSNIVHNSMVMNTHLCKEMISSQPFMQEEFLKIAIIAHAQALTDYIAKNPREFTA